MAIHFKKEFVYTRDERLIWHYWPSEFYSGWGCEDNLSSHTPESPAFEDYLFEDISHSGSNVAFMFQYAERFGYDIFTENDFILLKNTLDKIFLENGKMSHFMR